MKFTDAGKKLRKDYSIEDSRCKENGQWTYTAKLWHVRLMFIPSQVS